MFQKKILATALAVAFGMPLTAAAANESELAQIREQIKQLKESYETRIQALEQRVLEAEVNPPQRRRRPHARPLPPRPRRPPVPMRSIHRSR